MTRRYLTALALALSVTSCAESTSPPKASVLVTVLHRPVTAVTGPIESGTVATVGVRIRIENRTEYEIQVSRCDAQLFRAGSTAVLVAEQRCSVMTPRIVLAPGESAEQEYLVRGCADGTCLVPQWTGAISGRYQFVVGVDIGVPGLDPMNAFAISRSFDVLHVVPVH
jgi:hypothetical protein